MKKKTTPRARSILPLPQQASLPLGDPEVIEVEAADQLGEEMLESDACPDAEELQDALLAFATAADEQAVHK